MLGAGTSLAELGIRSGDVLAAAGAVRRHAGDHVPEEREPAPPGPFSVAWFTVAVGVAALAGWFASRVGGLDTVEGQVDGRRCSASRRCSGCCRSAG